MKKMICDLCGKEFDCSMTIRCKECFLLTTGERKKAKNKTERDFQEMAAEHGWEATKCGYPDFICYKGDEIMLVEVKAGNQKLRKEQVRFAKAISKYGVRCVAWRPSDGENCEKPF